MKAWEYYKKYSDIIGRKISDWFSTMEMFWAFNILALSVLISSALMPYVQFISSGYLQLVALPVISYTGALAAAKIEKLIVDIHRNTMESHDELRALISELHDKHAELHKLIAEDQSNPAD